MNLQQLEKAAAVCTECSLHKGRNNPVFAKGNTESKIIICGMVPAHEETKAGIPFVGRSGKLLDIILEEVGFSLNNVYITNICKCFLEPGKPLQQEWIDRCLPYLLVQIQLIKPKIIITLGKDSSINLLGLNEDISLGKMRKNTFLYQDKIRVIPTYHPSYLLRKGGKNSPDYGKVIDDFLSAKEILNKDLTNTI